MILERLMTAKPADTLEEAAADLGMVLGNNLVKATLVDWNGKCLCCRMVEQVLRQDS